MSPEPFQIIPLLKRSFFQKIFGQHPEENAVIEVNNLLASKEIKEISESEILEIERKYNINLSSDFSLNFEEFYATYFNYCKHNVTSSPTQQEDLNHLKAILKLSDSTTENIIQRIGEVIYKETYDNAIANGHLPDEDDHDLVRVVSEFKLGEEITNRISSDSRCSYMNHLVEKITADGKISPDEWNELNDAAKNLKVDIKIDDKTQSQLERLKLNWQIENGSLPVLQTGINLQPREECYFSHAVDWLEHRNVIQRVNYGGPTARIRIMKGLYYHAGSIAVNRITADQIQLIDSGTIYLTNKRVIFIGNKKNSNIRLDKILSIVPYSDGVELEKDSGKSPILRMTGESDIFAMMITRLMKEK